MFFFPSLWKAASPALFFPSLWKAKPPALYCLFPKNSLAFLPVGFSFSGSLQFCPCRLPALSLGALAARLAFLLKLPQLTAADPDGSHFSWQWRGTAFPVALNPGSSADPLSLLPCVLLRPFKKRCPQGIWVACCLLLWG